MPSIPQPDNDWKLAPMKSKQSKPWINHKGYNNFLSKTELAERSQQRGLARMQEIKAKLNAKSKLAAELRSEEQWRKHHESGEGKKWRSLGKTSDIEAPE